MAIADKPAVTAIESNRRTEEVMPVVMVGDTISEPGNAGGLLRSMAACGASTLILSERSTYPWDVKVLRAGAGAHFLVPIRTLSLDRIQAYVQEMDAVFFADSPSSHASDEPGKLYHEIRYFASLSSRVALFLGSEAQGFSPEVRAISSEDRHPDEQPIR